MATRTYGLSGSGMDIDSLVKNLMQAKRIKYDTLGQKKTQLEWKKAEYNTMYSLTNDFRSNTIFNYKLQSTLSPKMVSSSSDATVSATANADAVTFNHAITVTALAQSSSMTSTAAISNPPLAAKTTLVSHLGITAGVINLSISDGTTTKALLKPDLTPYDTTGKSIYDLVSDINKLGLNVKASYDSTLDRFFLNNTKSGAASQITLSSTDAAGTGANDLVARLKLGASANLTTAVAGPLNFVTGQDAVVTLDGVAGITQSSNKFTISGVTYNLKTLGSATISVSPDTDKVVANVKSFIEAFNTTLGKIDAEISQVHDRNYLPLTDDQKATMKEADITAWEAKAKTGLLQRDPILQDLMTKMRSNLSSPVAGLTGSYTTASSLGITSGTYSEHGKLYLDENKLRTALQADPEVVNKIFGSTGTSSSSQGIAVRLYDTLKASSDKIVTVAGITASTALDTRSSLAKSINNYVKQMYDLNTKLTTTENNYYTKFNAMESALQKLNQQSSWLTQQAQQ